MALIGAVDSFTVSTNPAGDPTAHTYSAYPLPAEMTAYLGATRWMNPSLDDVSLPW